MRSRIGIGRQQDDLLRKRIDDVLSKTSRGAFADGEWLDAEAGLPYAPVRAPYGTTQGPLDELRHVIDARWDAADYGAAPFDLGRSTEAQRVPPRYGARESLDRDELFALVSERATARSGYEYDRLSGSGTHPTPSAFDRTALPIQPRFSVDAAFGERSWRSTVGPGPEPQPAAVSSRFEPPRGMFRQDGIENGFGERPWGDALHGDNERPARHLDSIARQLDDLAREVDRRETGATSDEIAAFKQRLTMLARETEFEAARKLLGAGRSVRTHTHAAPAEFERYSRSEDSHEHRDWERPAGGAAAADFDDVGQRPGPPGSPIDAGRSGSLESDLSDVLNSVTGARRDSLPDEPPGPNPDAEAELVPPKRGDLVVAASERWLARPHRKPVEAVTACDRSPSSIGRELPPIPTARSMRPRKRRASRSTIIPIVRAGLAAVLAIAIVVPGAYFARSQMTDAPATVIVRESAPTGENASSGPLAIMPANSVARFRDLVFQLPRLYGIYAINSGRLFELEALPGQAPDPRIAVSAAIPRPSRTVLPDGQVGFLLFRRDMATNVPERVQIRVVAKIKRSTTGPEAEPRPAGSDETWTIRNIAVDFRVAPVEHNKEMVLLLSEKADFNFSPGRYALILKGQAYDFTVAGPVTDSAQCLERVEAANGGFFHECQAPQAKPAEMSAHEPAAAPSTSKHRRRGEAHARAENPPANRQALP
jgi:hypothetical protein